MKRKRWILTHRPAWPQDAPVHRVELPEGAFIRWSNALGARGVPISELLSLEPVQDEREEDSDDAA